MCMHKHVKSWSGCLYRVYHWPTAVPEAKVGPGEFAIGLLQYLKPLNRVPTTERTGLPPNLVKRTNQAIQEVLNRPWHRLILITATALQSLVLSSSCFSTIQMESKHACKYGVREQRSISAGYGALASHI